MDLLQQLLVQPISQSLELCAEVTQCFHHPQLSRHNLDYRWRSVRGGRERQEGGREGRWKREGEGRREGEGGSGGKEREEEMEGREEDMK